MADGRNECGGIQNTVNVDETYNGLSGTPSSGSSRISVHTARDMHSLVWSVFLKRGRLATRDSAAYQQQMILVSECDRITKELPRVGIHPRIAEAVVLADENHLPLTSTLHQRRDRCGSRSRWKRKTIALPRGARGHPLTSTPTIGSIYRRARGKIVTTKADRVCLSCTAC
jgi:hypothetical protein